MIHARFSLSEAKPPIPREEIILTEFAAGQGVLVDLNTKQYYMLNETALLVWHALARQIPASDVVAEMTSIYDVAPERAEVCIQQLVADLRISGLVG